jgi:integrase/recombinase XerD
MNGNLSSATTIDQWIAAWLSHQRMLGRCYDQTEWVLRHMRGFIANIPASDLDEVGFDLWCHSFHHLSNTTRRMRQLIVRKFCLYRQRAEPDCFVPNPLYFARWRPHRSPVIITPKQIAQLCIAADNLTPKPGSPLLPEVMRLAIVLLYTAGLRRGELVRLTLDDIESRTGVLRIRESKFHKSRMIPLSSGSGDELRTYLRHRLAAPFDTRGHAPLLCNGKGVGHGYTGAGLGQAINRLFMTAKIVDNEGRRPRVHDVRHSFAVEALMRWYREGVDVQSSLPRLAMYMGHVSIVSTAHYLHFVPAMREIASDRFQASYGELIKELIS